MFSVNILNIISTTRCVRLAVLLMRLISVRLRVNLKPRTELIAYHENKVEVRSLNPSDSMFVHRHYSRLVACDAT